MNAGAVPLTDANPAWISELPNFVPSHSHHNTGSSDDDSPGDLSPLGRSGIARGVAVAGDDGNGAVSQANVLKFNDSFMSGPDESESGVMGSPHRNSLPWSVQRRPDATSVSATAGGNFSFLLFLNFFKISS